MLEPIPGPPGYPVVGNIFDLRDEVPDNGLRRLADKYGPIFRMNMYGQTAVFVSSVKLLQELADETRFHKVLAGGLARIKPKTAAGLFTSLSEDEPDWGQAHRVLMPAFGPLAITNSFDEMHDIATQLVLKWARMGPEHKIQATEDFTRLTLDTIALCAMDYRFNSFYSEEMHPFVQAMTRVLASGNIPKTLTGMLSRWAGGEDKNAVQDRVLMEKIAGEVVQHRRDNPNGKQDLLNAMILGKDPKTGESMRDELIIANMTTFLIAGHETTSGLLSFALANLLKHPATLRAAQEEVDAVLGQGTIKVHHLKELKYLNAVLREALRLNPTVPAFVRQLRPSNNEPQPSLGGYAISRDTKLVSLVSKSGQDPEVYGEDANEFRPERMLDGKFEKLPKAAWMPFGTGTRACIGRAFAWQEALLVLAIIIQKFDIRLDDPHYEMRVKQTLTVKPRDFYIRATPRRGLDATTIQRSMLSSNGAPQVKGINGHNRSNSNDKLSDLLILFGSNTGTCQTLATRLAADAELHGYHGKVVDMDSGMGEIQAAKNAIVITASYEGQPPDNAAHFVEWVESKAHDLDLHSLQYAVFGCGHSDWASTFQRIPTLVDDKLEQAKAQRLVQRGFSDAAKGDIFSDFDEWADNKFWPALANLRGDKPATGADDALQIDLDIRPGDRASQLRQDVQAAVVKDVETLTAPGEHEKHHLEVLLPSDIAYEPGDYLAILPLNPEASVQRVMTHYHIPWDATVVFKSSGSTSFPTNAPIPITSLLKGYVELAQPATKKDVRNLANHARDPSTQTALEALTTPSEYEATILAKRTSILDLLTHYPNIDLPFPNLLSILPPMRTRHYSISSSPLTSPTTCTITYSTLHETTPSLSNPSEPFVGVASSYLKSLRAGDGLQCAVRPTTNKAFRLPLQADKTPVLMFCAGTGLAPFRGFVQQRAELLKASVAGGKPVSLAPAMLFVGCRSATRDRLYADEIDEWAKAGAVDVRYAFSREAEHPMAKGCRYVQERMLKDKEDVYEMWGRGAKVYVCGSPALAESVREAAKVLVKERWEAKGREVEEEMLRKWFQEKRGERFVTDVFA